MFALFIFVLATVPAFAADKELKRFEKSPFNVLSNWFTSFGKRTDGTSVMKAEIRPLWLSADEIRDRKRSIGGGAGPVVEVVQHIAERLVEIAWRRQKNLPVGFHRSIWLAKARLEDDSI